MRSILDFINKQQPQQQGLTEQILAQRFQPNSADVRSAINTGYATGSDINPQDYADNRMTNAMQQIKMLQALTPPEMTPYQREHLDLQWSKLGGKGGVGRGSSSTGTSGTVGAPGSPAAAPISEGKQNLEALLAEMKNDFTNLYKGGGLTTSTGNFPGTPDWLSNPVKRLQNTGFGQGVGQMFGTKNQSLRNNISSKRQMLKNAVMKATGMSAKQMDSNVELKAFLDSLSNFGGDIESNLRIIGTLSQQYGTGENAFGGEPTPAQGIIPPTPEEEAEYMRLKGMK